jgi:hypothetical protein
VWNRNVLESVELRNFLIPMDPKPHINVHADPSRLSDDEMTLIDEMVDTVAVVSDSSNAGAAAKGAPPTGGQAETTTEAVLPQNLKQDPAAPFVAPALAQASAAFSPVMAMGGIGTLARARGSLAANIALPSNLLASGSASGSPSGKGRIGSQQGMSSMSLALSASQIAAAGGLQGLTVGPSLMVKLNSQAIRPPKNTDPDMIEPLYGLIDELFELNQRGWVRRQAVW